jgi:hypothetical protein
LFGNFKSLLGLEKRLLGSGLLPDSLILSFSSKLILFDGIVDLTLDLLGVLSALLPKFSLEISE